MSCGAGLVKKSWSLFYEFILVCKPFSSRLYICVIKKTQNNNNKSGLLTLSEMENM